MRYVKLGLVVVLAMAVTACGASSETDGDANGPSSASATPTATVSPDVPTDWMLAAAIRWQHRSESQYGAFKSVRKDGELWTGDPRLYEKACGATFLVDGTTPDLENPMPGGSANGQTYYRWLQSDPQRWGAFNAWLKDPAVVHSLSDGLTGDLSTYVGDSSTCKDPSAAHA